MIISASRRTDIPAFYAQWFINRVRAGFCLVPNPFNPHQVSTVPLRGPEVEALVLWTRDIRPLLPHLDELRSMVANIYVLFTVTGYGPPLEVNIPPTAEILTGLRHLAVHIGPENIAWRYDPIVFSSVTDLPYHLQQFQWLAAQLAPFCERVIVSLLHPYRKCTMRFKRMAAQGISVHPTAPPEQLQHLAPHMRSTCEQIGLPIQHCCSPLLEQYGINAGACLDADHFKRCFGIQLSPGKDSGQRSHCMCTASKDIGIYNTCLHGCQYCYATTNHSTAQAHYQRHNPHGELLIPSRTEAPIKGQDG